MAARISMLSTLFLILGLTHGAHASCDIDYSESPKTLQSLEDAAGRGALTKDKTACLEAAYTSAEKMTTKDKISRVLLINAYAYNTKLWADLASRHLEEIDQSDPAISYLYVFYLHNRQVPEFERVIKWSEVALVRRSEWRGRTYTNRTFQLMKVRALAATALWEQKLKASESEQAEEMRLLAKTYSREWLNFANSAGWDTTEAELLCISAANKEACGII